MTAHHGPSIDSTEPLEVDDWDDLPDWVPPSTFRELVEDADRLARELASRVSAQPALLLPAAEINFLARRLARVVAEVHEALPPEVI